MQKVCLEIPAL